MKYRSFLGPILVCSVLGSAAGLLHCSSDDPAPSGTVTGVAGKYRGSLTGTGDLAGTLELTLTEAPGTAPASLGLRAASRYNVTGSVTVNVPGVGPVALTGTVDAAKGTIEFSGTGAGGLVSFSGTYQDGVLRGTFTSPWGPGSFTLGNEQLGGLRVFCGKFTGTTRGRWSLFTVGTRAGGVFAATTGEQGVLGGTATSTGVTLTVPPSGNATGSIVGEKIGGDWSNGAGQSGTFSVTEGGCRILEPQQPSTVTDGGVDSGPQDSGPSQDSGPVTDSGLAAEQTIAEINNHSFSGIAAGGNLVHYVVEAIPHQLWYVRPDGTQKTKIYDGTFLGIATTDKNVFWVGGSGLYSMSVLGNPQPTTLATDLGTVNEIVADASDLFVTQYDPAGSVRKFSQSGTPGGSYANQGFVRGLSVDASNLYWSTVSEFVNYTGRGIWRAPKAMGGTVTPVIPAEDFGGPKAVVNYIAVEGNDLFAISFETTPNIAYRLLQRPKDGSGTTQTLFTKSQIGAINADANYVYYSDFEDSRPAAEKAQLWRIPRSNLMGTAQSIFKSNEGIRRVALDTANVYAVTTQKIVRLSKTP